MVIPLSDEIISDFFLCLCSTATLAWSEDYDSRTTIESRLQELELSVPVYYSTALQRRLNEYFKRDIRPTQEMLARMVQYFPEIEKALRDAGLPESLKYMVVEESRIDPLAMSADGAVGLWQLMPSTALELGLEMNTVLDERRDVARSTQAAIIHLKALYERYEDWALVMAAYNGGVTRLNRVIRRVGSRDWHQLKQHLPSEMRDFIPRYLASAYLCNFYRFHGLNYSPLNLDLLMVKPIEIRGEIGLTEIAQKCHLPSYVIYQLNPKYKCSYLPDSSMAYTLNLPTRVIEGFMKRVEIADYVIDNKTRESVMFYSPSSYYITSLYVTDEEEDLIELSDTLGTDPFILKYYNHLNSLTLSENQSIQIVSMK